MNIFVLDREHSLCAQYHNDRHCIKMILETTQLLNNAMIANVKNYIPVYKPTHIKHPCSIWASKSKSNFDWLKSLGMALCSEYTYRYGKTHKCQALIESFSSTEMEDVGLTDFALCMPDQYKSNDVVSSYRKYYKEAKAHIASWKNREKPWWLQNDEVSNI